MEAKLEKTERGFGIVQFRDRNGVSCSLQKSSIASEDAIWFGCNDIDLQLFTPGKGWESIPLTKDHIANTRMHLTQEQVIALLPYLKRFAETGEL